jgi:hypothetical protein
VSLLIKLKVTNSKTRWLIAIISISVTIRVMVALYMGDQVASLPGIFDQVSYDMMAQQLLKGHGFTVPVDWWPATPAGEPTAHWSFLYSLYLAAVYALFGYQPLIARLIQASVAGILMPWLAYRLGRQYFGEEVGLTTAGLSAVYLYFVYYAAALVTETFYIIAILWILNLARQLGQSADDNHHSKPWRDGFGLGVALVIAVLLRQVFLLFIPILFLWLLWRSYFYRGKSIMQMARVLVIATTILVLSIVPWTYRNYQAFGRFVLLNTNAGFAFYWGNHPIHGYNFIAILPEDGASYQSLIPAEFLSLNEAELDQTLLKQAVGFIQADPGRYAMLSFSRVKDYFKFWPSPDSGLTSNLSRVFSFGLFLPLMLYGLIHSLRYCRSGEMLLLYLFMASYTAIHLLSWALIRYRLPIDAVLLIFAGLAVVEIGLGLTRQHPKIPGSLEYKTIK